MDDQTHVPTPERARIHIWVQGRVQGVGFRAFVHYHAEAQGLTGWVRNIGYDQVEVVAEGERARLESFCRVVQSGPPGSRVVESRLEWENHVGEFLDFNIRSSR